MSDAEIHRRFWENDSHVPGSGDIMTPALTSMPARDIKNETHMFKVRSVNIIEDDDILTHTRPRLT